MPSKHKTALILTVKDRHLKSERKARNKKEKLYQNWLVWTVGASVQVIAHEYALRKTKALWLKLYSDKIQRRQIVNVNLVRLYLGEHQVDYFLTRELCLWAVEKGYVQPSWKSKRVQGQSFLAYLVQGHYINQLPNKKAYTLTQRARLLLVTYERYLKEFIQPSQTPPTSSQVRT